ncbi:MAG: hypothetical protein M0Z28_01135 [Rhodospirillales bacterium]|nr:hypothetical protein [Rhodospirillales bacterium]
MTQPPSRLSAGLLAVQKGAAAPAEVAPVTPSTTSPAPLAAAASQPVAPTTMLATSRLDLVRRAPPAEIKRSSFSTRLPDEMQEWLRVKAFVERRGVQDVVEEAIAFYRQHVERGGEG